jgi:proteic killer suppression protein
MAIRDYRDKRTADFVAGERVREFQAFARQAARGIAKLQSVTRLVELRNPPSNRFEALGGNRAGQYSIRINDQWRLCFKWAVTDDTEGIDELLMPGEPYDVEITDYH